jgi:hypothetical protein
VPADLGPGEVGCTVRMERWDYGRKERESTVFALVPGRFRRDTSVSCCRTATSSSGGGAHIPCLPSPDRYDACMAVWYVRCLITLTVGCIRSQSDVSGGPSRGGSALPQCARGRVLRGILTVAGLLLHWRGRRSSPVRLSFRSCDIDTPAGSNVFIFVPSSACLAPACSALCE